VNDVAEANVVLPDKTGNRYLLAPTMLTGTIVSDATAEIDAQTGAWVVNVVFTGSGSSAWDAMAQQLYQKQLAIVLDSEVISAPVIQTTQFGGRAQISGTFTSAEAKQLAVVLRYGSLPVKLEPQTVQTVSASLGKDSLQAGLVTGLIGLALVAAYMVFYYRALGLVVIAGLSVSGALLWTITSLLTQSRGLALSLSGAVGIIVSVGVTVDSYVVYFERLRDEIRHGKTLRSSVDRGFKRAWRTILAADLVSLIGALALYFLTVGSVRGFAFFLAMSTLLDLFVAYFFTRPLVSMLGKGTFFTTGPLGIGHNMDVTGAVNTAATPTRIVPGSAGGQK
jgi:preprotein translocase subunit SecD